MVDGQACRSKLRKVVLAAGGVAVWLAALAPQKAAATPACTEILRNFSASVSGETSGESGDAGSCGGTEAPELSLTFTAPRAGSYTFDTFGSAFDTVLYVRSENGTELGCNDDVQLGVHAWSRVRVTLGAEQTVRVIVDGFGSQSGAFVLRIHAECPLPFRADARDLGSASTWVIRGSTTCAPMVGPATSCGAVPWGPGTSFVYTAPFSGTYEFSSEGSQFDTLLVVQLGTCSGAELACNDDIGATDPGASRVRVELAVGQTVVITLAGKGEARGEFVLSGVGVPFTPTITATRTASRTATATRSHTVSPSATSSRTFTPSRVPTASPSPTASPTPSRTRTARATPTPSDTARPTATATRLVTATPPLSATPSPTPTATPSASPLPSPLSTICCEWEGGGQPARCELSSVAQCGALGGTVHEDAVCTEQGCRPRTEGSATASPTLTATPSVRPTWTFLPSLTATATSLARVVVEGASLRPGASIAVAGEMPPGHGAARLWMIDASGKWWPFGQTAVAEHGGFRAVVQVPAPAAPGPARVCAVPTAPGREPADLVCTHLPVEDWPPAQLDVAVRSESGALAQGSVYLFSANGIPRGAAKTGSSGVARFGTVPAGIYTVRAVCERGSECGEGYVPPGTVVLAPGSRRSLVLRAVPPPAEADLDWAGTLLLPGGLLQALDPVAQPLRAGQPWLFPSLEGLGLPPLLLRFWAVPRVPVNSAVPVAFRVWGGDELLFSRTAMQPEPVYAFDPLWSFPAYTADWNLSGLPAGDLRVEVEAAGGPVRSFSLFGEALSGRWAGVVGARGSEVGVASNEDTLRTRLAARLFQPDWSWDLQLAGAPGSSLRWSGNVEGLLLEEWDTDGRWSGAIRGTLSSHFRGDEVVSSRAVSVLRGSDLTAGSYEWSGVAETTQCAAIAPNAGTVSFDVSACEGCPPTTFRRPFTPTRCLPPRARFEVHGGTDLRMKGWVALEAAQTAWLSVEEPIGLCRARLWGRGNIVARAKVLYDPARTPALLPENEPCLSLRERWWPVLQCAGATFARAAMDFGDSSPCTAPPPAESPEQFWPNPLPAAASHGSGRAVLLWTRQMGRESSAGSLLLWREVHGTAVQDPRPLEGAEAAVDSPAIASVGGGRLLAVWVQGDASAERSPRADPATATGRGNLWSAVWEGGSWSAPSPLTQDAVADGPPVLVSGDGVTELFWLRGSDGGRSSAANVHWARFAPERGWVFEGPVLPEGGAVIRNVAAGRMADGSTLLAWIEEQGMEPAHVRARKLVGGSWSAVDDVVIPAGVWPSAVRVVEGAPLPVLVVRAISASEAGPGGSLYIVVQESGRWLARAVVREPQADEFAALARDEEVFVFFRGVGGGLATGGNGELWAAVVRGATVQGPVRLTSDGAGHLSPVAIAMNEETVLVADVHQRAPSDQPEVALHRWPLLPDLVVESAHIEPSSGALTGGAGLVVSVSNRGLDEIRVPVRVSVNSGTFVRNLHVAPAQLPPGRRVELTFEDVPVLPDANEIEIRVDEDEAVRESDEANNVLRVLTGPQAPVVLGYTLDTVRGEVVIEWEPVSSAVEYRVYRGEFAHGAFELWSGTTATQFRDVLDTPASSVRYRVTAVDGFGKESPASAAIEVTGILPASGCTGDCNEDGSVTIDELLLGVNIALELKPLVECSALDANHDGQVTIEEILRAVGQALTGCAESAAAR
ncbi:MAG: hypothetical protein KatS3mg077_1598 [Candidatus Binatia bacterium]|nr:MAG: hypothetical protein KatS3mg077_1598 [Candidatus Binatia bacterium]